MKMNFTDLHRQRISNALKGRRFSIPHRQRLSERAHTRQRLRVNGYTEYPGVKEFAADYQVSYQTAWRWRKNFHKMRAYLKEKHGIYSIEAI